MSNEPQFRPELQVLHSPPETALARCYDMFMLHQEASRHTPRTIDNYRQKLTPFLNFLAEKSITTAEQITAHTVRQYLVKLERRGLKDITILGYARCIQAFCNFLVKEELLVDSPMRKVAMPKVEKQIKKPFTRDDIAALLKACDQGRYKLRDRAMILCLLDTGLRASEFVAMNVGDVDQSGMVKVMGKGKKERYVRLGARARKAMLRYLAARDEARPGAPLWAGNKGRLTTSGLFQVMKRTGKRAGVWPVGPHRFRRTFATWSAKAGIDAHSLRFLLGHETLDVARHYVAMVKADIEEAHKRTSPVDNFLSKPRR